MKLFDCRNKNQILRERDRKRMLTLNIHSDKFIHEKDQKHDGKQKQKNAHID